MTRNTKIIVKVAKRYTQTTVGAILLPDKDPHLTLSERLIKLRLRWLKNFNVVNGYYHITRYQ